MHAMLSAIPPERLPHTIKLRLWLRAFDHALPDSTPLVEFDRIVGGASGVQRVIFTFPKEIAPEYVRTTVYRHCSTLSSKKQLEVFVE